MARQRTRSDRRPGSAQGRGTGKALLLAALHAMRTQGYAYAIIGGAGGDLFGFYAKTAGVVVIDDSTPGVDEGLPYEHLPTRQRDAIERGAQLTGSSPAIPPAT